ncbi:MAG: DUF459 domain-containing protein, partial [Pseudolabrys sp.]|nr:DUF459 domain-containing protein [Pseudolabrys sp.]
MTLARSLAGAATLALAIFAATVPADAQFGGFDSRRGYQRSPGFFDRLFGPNSDRGGGSGGYYGGGGYYEQQPAIDSSRAPPPKKTETSPTLSVMVLGDSMADWLAYGLEDALSDSPEIGVVRKSKLGSGLLRYETKSDLDWWHVARDLLGKEKADIVVMMLGINDRQPFRETAPDKTKGGKDTKKPEPDKAATEAKTDAKTDAKPDASKEASTEQKNDDEGEQPSILAPEPRSAGGAKGVTDFRTEKWEEAYTKRIDETIAALKSKGVPVIWVGLPPLRGTRSTADVQYLNDLYRARAEKAGIV